jgi:glucokinase
MALYQSGSSALSEHSLEGSSSQGFVAGVDIGGTSLRVTLASMTGTILGRWSTSTVGIREPDLVVRLICEGVDVLLKKHSSSRADLRAIAAGAPGITDTGQGIVLATSYLMGWTNVPLRNLLEAALGIPAFVDNDVNMAAHGEYHAGSALGVDNFVFLAIGTGVGAGIILNGQLFRGYGWIAGEIGYMLVPGVSVDAVSDKEPGALEEIVGGEGIRRHWQSVWSENETTLPREATATQIFDRALQRDVLARMVLERSSRTLAYAIYNISLVLNCPLFVLGGSVGLHPALGDAARATLQALNERVQPRVAISSLGTEAQLTGAIFQAIKIAGGRNRAVGETSAIDNVDQAMPAPSLTGSASID